MPHPARVEEAAAIVEAAGERLDDAIAEQIATGRRAPSAGQIIDAIRPEVEAAVIAAMADVDVELTATELAAVVAGILDELAVLIRRALRDADRRTRQVDEARRRDPDEDRPTGGALLFAVLLVEAERRRRRALTRREMQRLAAKAGRPMPMSVAAKLRQVVRTRVAVERNVAAATVAASRVGWVLYVEDARNGPTDEPCERVSNRFASALWVRRNPVEHPNCTRRCRPMPLPPGRFVTLLE